MVVIKLEMWPGGDETKAYHLGTLKIILDATTRATDTVRNYTWLASKKGSSGVWKAGRVEGHRPKSQNQWDLLYRVLRQMVGHRNPPEKD